MNKSIPNCLKRLLKEQSPFVLKKRTHKTSMMMLKTKIWISALLKNQDVDIKELITKFTAAGEPKTIKSWLNNTRSASPVSVKRVDKQYPGSSDIYHLPVFTLLEPNITKSKIAEVMSPYLSHNSIFWGFPNTLNGLEKTPALLPHILDSKGLFERGDIYGFMGILYLLRMAEIEKNSFWHIAFLKDAYCALPGFCRYQPFTPYWEEFYDALCNLHHRMQASIFTVCPKKKIIEKQIMSNEHITLRPLRPRDPNTYRFTELELPYMFADFKESDFSDTEFG